MTFEPGELGVALATEEYPEAMKQVKKKSNEKVGSKMDTSMEESARTNTNETGVEANSSDGRGQIQCTDCESGGSHSSVGAEVTAATLDGVGVTSNVKGKRRIHPTILESFTPPSSASDGQTPPSPLPPPTTPSGADNVTTTTAAPPTGSDTDSDIITCTNGDDQRYSVMSSNPQEKMDSTCVNEASANGKKPRRIQLVTLSSVPQTSHDSGSKSCDQNSTHLSPSETVSDDVMEISSNE